MSLTVIIGLRRSGTTIFWEWFRQDQRFTCFDEPFSEQLLRLPSEHPKKIFAEYQQVMCISPEAFWRAYAPIHRAEELDPFFTERQRAFLRFLADQGEDVVLDLTRCHLKVRQLADLFPEATFLHLTRDERAFASSHLLPSRTDLRGRVQQVLLERSFWTRTGTFDFWGMESLCGTAPGSKLSLLLARDGYDADGFYALPAVGRLMVLHRFLTGAAARDLAEIGRSSRVVFEEFTRDPEDTLAKSCAEAGAPQPRPTGAWTPRDASPGHRPGDRRWDEIRGRVDAVCPAQDLS